jgi:hypothetical protein
MRTPFMERISRERAEQALSRYPRRPTSADAVANELAALRDDLRDALDRIEGLENPPGVDPADGLRDLERRVDELEDAR